MKIKYLCRLVALLLIVGALSASTALADSAGALPVPQVTFHIELIKTTAGDVAKSSMPFDYTPFAPAVLGNIPLNRGVSPSQDEGSLATVTGAGATMFEKYLHAHGKTLAKPTIKTVDGVPATISLTEPIKGPIGEAVSGGINYTTSLSTKVQVSSKVAQDGTVSYSVTVNLVGGQKQPNMTMVSEETIKIDHQGPGGETFAFGGLASSESNAAAGVPLLTDGLSSDGGFGAADPKTPVLFVLVTATVGPGSI